MFKDLILFDIGNIPFNVKYEKVNFSNLKNYKKKEIVIMEGNTINRDILENKDVDILVNPSLGIKKDSLHYRNSGLNHILCNIAKRNNIQIGFSFNEVLNSNNRGLILGRMMQNVRLCRKFKVKMLIASFARNEHELRSHDTLKAFGLVIGMTPGESERALNESNNLKK